MLRRLIIPYEPHLKDIARALRHNMSFSERLLWGRLRGKQMRGIDLHRQRPLDRYIVDFYTPDLLLAVEIDGLSHDTPTRSRADSVRQARLEQWGIRFLRFEDEEVRCHLENVLTMIEAWIVENGYGDDT